MNYYGNYFLFKETRPKTFFCLSISAHICGSEHAALREYEHLRWNMEWYQRWWTLISEITTSPNDTSNPITIVNILISTRLVSNTMMVVHTLSCWGNRLVPSTRLRSRWRWFFHSIFWCIRIFQRRLLVQHLWRSLFDNCIHSRKLKPRSH